MKLSHESLEKISSVGGTIAGIGAGALAGYLLTSIPKKRQLKNYSYPQTDNSYEEYLSKTYPKLDLDEAMNKDIALGLSKSREKYDRYMNKKAQLVFNKYARFNPTKYKNNSWYQTGIEEGLDGGEGAKNPESYVKGTDKLTFTGGGSLLGGMLGLGLGAITKKKVPAIIGGTTGLLGGSYAGYRIGKSYTDGPNYTSTDDYVEGLADAKRLTRSERMHLETLLELRELQKQMGEKKAEYVFDKYAAEDNFSNMYEKVTGNKPKMVNRVGYSMGEAYERGDMKTVKSLKRISGTSPAGTAGGALLGGGAGYLAGKLLSKKFKPAKAVGTALGAITGGTGAELLRRDNKKRVNEGFMVGRAYVRHHNDIYKKDK